MRSVFVTPSTCAVSWTEPTPIAARPLLAELIGYLEQDALPAAARARAEAVLLDLLEPIPMHPALELRMPVSDQARRVAVALRSAPADRRTLQEWGRDGRHEQPDPGAGLHSRKPACPSAAGARSPASTQPYPH